jgi:hypothetical protein
MERLVFSDIRPMRTGWAASVAYWSHYMAIDPEAQGSIPGTLELGPLSLMRITEELLEWKSSASGAEHRY